ncbi:hypothetical protein [Hydrogenophaga crocea]|uniref:Uncharacterized protein n=1 Tax=Hydrogenophaga crocea TaxID=2716225 RepID=A0A6G8IEJ0_9BURK|nr:hypothetical protein [Hydrogenophaga crocea]QIM51607.1 hypothetical protein G9Q37_05365 [Hydrogenophaga crocea]
MNCKPGDLAVIVRSGAQNAGKLVEIARPATQAERKIFDHRREGFHWWVCSIGTPIVDSWGDARMETALPDAWLRPIRDPGDDATDEMVQLLGKPQEVTA